MSFYARAGVALQWTIGLMVAGVLYAEVFSAELLPIVNTDGTFSTPVVWLDRLVPLIIVFLLLAVWGWVIAGSVQEERSVDRRRRV